MENQNASRNRRFYQRPSFQTYKAMFLVLLASACMCFNSLVVKLIRGMTAAELGWMRNASMLIINIPFLIYHRSPDITNKSAIPTLVGRGIFGLANLFFMYLGFKLMPIADASVINSTTPVWVVILSRIILKERLDLLNSLSVLFSMVGLLLMSRVFSLIYSSPKEKYSDTNYWYGCLSSLLNALILAFVYVLLRKLKGIHESVTLFYHSAIGTIGMAFVVMASWNVNLPNCGLDGLFLVLLGLSSFAGQMLMTVALKIEKAGAVSSVRTSSQVVLTFLIQLCFLSDVPDVYAILAAVCMFVSLWLSGMRKYYQQKRRDKTKTNNAVEEEETPKRESSV